MTDIEFELITKEAIVPTRANEQDAGIDIYATHLIKQNSSGVFMLGTGLRATPSDNSYYLEMYPRSSISKTDFTLANSVGIIDTGYRGEIIIAMRPCNADAKLPPFPWKCAQLIAKKRHTRGVKIVPKLPDANDQRSVKGFGSSD